MQKINKFLSRLFVLFIAAFFILSVSSSVANTQELSVTNVDNSFLESMLNSIQEQIIKIQEELAKLLQQAEDSGITAMMPSVLTPNLISTAAPYTLTVNATTGGSVIKSPDQTSYNVGKAVFLNAKANSGYTFTGWSGDLTGNTNPQWVWMYSNKTITARFSPKEDEPANLKNPIKKKFSCESFIEDGEVINGMCYSKAVCNTTLRNENFQVTVDMQAKNYKVGDPASMTLNIENLKNDNLSLTISNQPPFLPSEWLYWIEIKSDYFTINTPLPRIILAPREKRSYTFSLTAEKPSEMQVPISVLVYFKTGTYNPYEQQENIASNRWFGCGITVYSKGDIKCGKNLYDLPSDGVTRGQCLNSVFYPDFVCEPFTVSVDTINGRILPAENTMGKTGFCLGLYYQDVSLIDMLVGQIELVFIPANNSNSTKKYSTSELAAFSQIASESTQKINQWFDKESQRLFGKNIVDFTYKVENPIEEKEFKEIINRYPNPENKVFILVVHDYRLGGATGGAAKYNKKVIKDVAVNFSELDINNMKATLLHELGHGFGAVDIYTYISSRWRLCPKSLMGGMEGISYYGYDQLNKDICLTAYEVGWTDLNMDGIPDAEKNPFENFITPKAYTCSDFGGVCREANSPREYRDPSGKKIQEDVFDIEELCNEKNKLCFVRTGTIKKEQIILPAP